MPQTKESAAGKSIHWCASISPEEEVEQEYGEFVADGSPKLGSASGQRRRGLPVAALRMLDSDDASHGACVRASRLAVIVFM